MTGVASAAAVLLAAVFVWAALSKLLRPAATGAAFAGLGLPRPGVLAVAVPVGEIGVAALLVVRPQVGGALALAALAGFSLVVVRAVMRGTRTGCGCFGSRRDDPVSPVDVVRNGLLAAFALVATGTHRLVAPGLAGVAGVAAGVVVASGVMAVASHQLRRT